MARLDLQHPRGFYREGMKMEKVHARMTREAAVKEAQRIADETGIYMLVLVDKN